MAIAGLCRGCNHGIPHGYLYHVTRWETQYWRTKPVQVAKDIWCKDCWACVSGKPRPKRSVSNMEENEQEQPKIPAAEIAWRLLGAMSVVEGYGSQKLAREANLPYQMEDDDEPGETIKDVLNKCQSLGFAIFAEGRWMKTDAGAKWHKDEAGKYSKKKAVENKE